MTRLSLSALLLACVAVWGGPRAEAFEPPEWWQRTAASYQEWRFDVDADPAEPEAVTNGYGIPSADITPGPFTSGWWLGCEVFGTRQGFWDLGSAGTISIELPPVEYQEIWVEVVYFEDLSAEPEAAVAGAEALSGPEIELVESISGGACWYRQRTTWRPLPESDASTIVITASAEWGSLIDNVTVYALMPLWPIPGDANFDCRVNILDMIFVRNGLSRDVGSGDNWKADVNEDRKINILDLIFVRNHLNAKCED